MSMIWPIALVVFSKIVYQICAKGVPKDRDAMASMTITYLVRAIWYRLSHIRCMLIIFLI